MAERAYPAVGELITAEELTELSGAQVLRYANAQALLADPIPAPLTLAVLLEEALLAVSYFLADGTPAWRALAPVAIPQYARQRTELRVPPTGISWDTPIGAVELTDAAAALDGGNFPTADGRLFDRASFAVGSQHAYAITGTEDLIANANCEVVLVAVGGGGSGAGMAFYSETSEGGVIYPHTPIGGGGGGGGEIVPLHLRLERGDVLTVSAGRGGEPTDVSGSGYQTVAAARAGSDTVVWLNGVETLRASGGAGGRSPDVPALDAQLNGAQIADGYALGGGGGGGITPAVLGQYAQARTANPPTGWKALNAEPPIGHRRRGGDGVLLPTAGGWARNSTQDWAAYAGAGGGGVSETGELYHGRAGAVDTGAASRVLPNHYTGGYPLAITGGSQLLGAGGGGGAAVGSGSRLADLTTLRGRSHNAVGAGSGGGGVWATTSTVSATVDAYSISYPIGAQDGAVFVRHPQPGYPLERYQPPPSGWTPRLLTNSAPLPPEVIVENAAEADLSSPLTIRIVPQDPDYGDTPTSWVLRRRIGAGGWQYLDQSTGQDANGTDDWDQTETPAARRIPDPDTGTLGYSYTLRAGWGTALTAVEFAAKTIDAGGLQSGWGAAAPLTPRAEIPPAIPLLSGIPTGGEAGAETPPPAANPDAALTLTWTHNDPDGTPQAGYRIFRSARSASGITEPLEVLTRALGGYGWLTVSPRDTSAVFDTATPGVVASAPTGSGEAGDNWIAGSAASLALDGSVWANRGTDYTYGFSVSTLSAHSGTVAQSPYAAPVWYSASRGACTLTGLPEGLLPPVSFGGASISEDFTVSPPDAAVSVSSSNDLFTAVITGTGANRTLTLTPPELGSGGAPPLFTDTVIITATAPGYSAAVAEIEYTFSIPPSAITAHFSGLASHYERRLGTNPLTDEFLIAAHSTNGLHFTSGNNQVATVSGALTGGVQHGRDVARLTITPTGVGSTTFSLAASLDGRSTGHYSGTIRINPSLRGRLAFGVLSTDPAGHHLSPSFVRGISASISVGLLSDSGQLVPLGAHTLELRLYQGAETLALLNPAETGEDDWLTRLRATPAPRSVILRPDTYPGGTLPLELFYSHPSEGDLITTEEFVIYYGATFLPATASAYRAYQVIAVSWYSS